LSIDIILTNLENSLDSMDMVEYLNEIYKFHDILNIEQRARLATFLGSHYVPLPLIRRKLGNTKYKTLTALP